MQISDKILHGLKTLARTVIFMILAPIVLSQAFKNTGHPMFIPVLIVGIILFLLALYFGFKGVNQIVKGIFDKD